MRTTPYRVAGSATTINHVETADDLTAFDTWLRSSTRILAIDTETTQIRKSIGYYYPGMDVRLIQVGDATTAYVLRNDLFGADVARLITREAAAGRRFLMHNASFDLQMLHHHVGIDVTTLGPQVIDTYILAHLLDPRSAEFNDVGLGLKGLSTVYVDPEAVDASEELTAVFKDEYKASRDNGWDVIDIDHPTYVLYAGLDVIYTSRLFQELKILVASHGLTAQVRKEHRFQLICVGWSMRGVNIDRPYTTQVSARLAAERTAQQAIAAKYGVANINSGDQVVRALQDAGHTFTERPKSWHDGKRKLAKDGRDLQFTCDTSVLLPLAGLAERTWAPLEGVTPNPIAHATLLGKRASKFRAAYSEFFLNHSDSADRIHPTINTLGARTGRMSIAHPALQQLPSTDWSIRRCIVPDPGKIVVAADYSAVELRMLAALADVPAMKEAIAAGRDLHAYTAELIYGPTFTKAQRGLAKGVGFGKVYGGGAATLSRQTGAPIDEVQTAVAAYDDIYPEVKKFGQRMTRDFYQRGGIPVTSAGRRQPLDRDWLYRATNYVVQGSARDVLVDAILRIDDAGLTSHVILPVHDEIVAQVDPADAEDFARTLGALMHTEFMGIPLDTEASVYGPTWAHGYGCEKNPCPITSPHPLKHGYTHSPGTEDV